MREKNDVWQDVALVSDSAAMVIVDMEKEFCRSSGKIYLGPDVAGVIEKLAALRKCCRDVGIPVIYVRSVRYPEDPDFTRFGREQHLIEGTDGSVIVEELTPLPGEPIVEKHTHDCFHKTEMDTVLRRMGIESETHQIIVTGVASNVCVYHAVLGFHVRHYRTVLPIDCMIGTDPGGNEFVIAQLSSNAYNYNVTLTTSDRISVTSPASR